MRWLTPFDYGLLSTGMIFVLLADVLAESGLGRALVQQGDLQPNDLNEAFSLSLGVSLLLYAILWIMAPGLAEFFDAAELTGFLRLPQPGGAADALSHRAAGLARPSTAHGTAIGPAPDGRRLPGGAGAGFGGGGLRLLGLVDRRAGGACPGDGRFAALDRLAAAWRWPGPRARTLLVFGLHLSLGSLLWFAYSNADYAIVGKTVGTVALGFYTLAFQLMSLPVQKLTANINQVAYPVFCRLQHDPVRMRAWYLRS